MIAIYQHLQTVTTATDRGPVTLTVEHHYEHSAPMSNRNRIAAYYKQGDYARPLSVRQLRACRKAHKRGVARAAVLLAGAR